MLLVRREFSLRLPLHKASTGRSPQPKLARAGVRPESKLVSVSGRVIPQGCQGLSHLCVCCFDRTESTDFVSARRLGPPRPSTSVPPITGPMTFLDFHHAFFGLAAADESAEDSVLSSNRVAVSRGGVLGLGVVVCRLNGLSVDLDVSGPQSLSAGAKSVLTGLVNRVECRVDAVGYLG